METPLFETARLQIREINSSDFDEMMTVYGDPVAMRWVDDGQPITEKDCRRWIKITRDNYANRGYGMFAVEDRRNGSVLGFCGLVHPGGQRTPEIKYALKRQAWGQGLASEMVPAMLQYAHRVHDLNEVIATIDPDNLASQRVVMKAGMELTETRRDEAGLPTQVYRWSSY
ncbi:MAG: GNAT family N-acetyltransferase [Gammaproteobacteria bacterium]|nr:GNAT family N-acetyltransferase [Gammaproteobacteria bacterium]